MLELYLIWIKYFYEEGNDKNYGNLDKKSFRICRNYLMGVHHLHHLKIPRTLYGTSTLLHGKYDADIWVIKHVLQRSGILGEEPSIESLSFK